MDPANASEKAAYPAPRHAHRSRTHRPLTIQLRRPHREMQFSVLRASAFRFLSFIDDTAGDDGGDGGAFESAPVKGRVPRLAGRLLHVVCPGIIEGKNREVSSLPCGNFALEAENPRGTRSEKLNHSHK